VDPNNKVTDSAVINRRRHLKQVRYAFVGMLAILGLVIVWWMRPSAVIPTPDQMTLFSLDGRKMLKGGSDPTYDGEHFYRTPVLGKIDVAAAADRRHLMQAMNEGLNDTGAVQAKCFWPRHGIRATTDGNTVDYLICFQCCQMQVYSGEQKTTLFTIGNSPQEAFDRFIAAAGLPLAAD